MLDTAKMLCYTAIDHCHRFTGSCNSLADLAICQHPEKNGFYVLDRVVASTQFNHTDDLILWLRAGRPT